MSEAKQIYHVPVLLNESVDGMNIQPGGIYVDATFGGGGHSKEILSRLDSTAHLYSFDQDEDAEKNIVSDSRFTFVRSNFRYLPNFLRYYGVEGVDAILADLGVSSHHFNVFQNLMHSSPLNYNDYYTITFHKAHIIKLPKIYGSSAIFKTTSPIMITNKIDNHKYKMLTIENDWESGEFMNAIKRELKFRLQNSPLQNTVDEMEIIPLKTKTVIMHAFGQVLIGNTGYLQINANPKLLNYIFEDGLGSKRGSFCGLLKLLRN